METGVRRGVSFAVGRHRPVYFWAGPTTVRMNRLKFMDAPVNEEVHLAAHSPRAARLLAEAGFNWAYLMYNWGFPPEQEVGQWADFRLAVRVFHEAGIRVSGYVQLSNCVYAGSHVGKDWYARDPWGKLIHYYTGRYMTCWLHPEWREQVRQRIGGVIEAGADGVFLDNPWMGLHALPLGGTWVSGAGCSCERCRESYARTFDGESAPRQLAPGDPATQRYLAWRAEVAWRWIDELAGYARSLRPGIVVAENVYDAINCNTYAEFGVDLCEAARLSDVVMIEDHSLPHLASDGTPVVDAITCKAARAWSDGTPVTTDPYIAGIGFDPVYTPRQFRRAVAEGAACATATVVKGTEFFDRRDGGFTLLTGEPFALEREALERIHRWLEMHAALYAGRREASPLAVYFPYDTLPFDWRYSAPLAFAACQALLAAGLPYRIVGPGDWDGVQVLIVPPSAGKEMADRLRGFVDAGGRLVCLGEGCLGGDDLPGMLVWRRERPGPSWLERHAALRAAVGRAAMGLYRAYFDHRILRVLLDRAHVTQRILHGGAEYNPLFALPSAGEREALLEARGDLAIPRVQAEKPVLIEWWRQGKIDQLHLVNYADEAQELTVSLPWEAQVQVLSPDGADGLRCEGRSLRLSLDVYAVLLCEVSSASSPRRGFRGN